MEKPCSTDASEIHDSPPPPACFLIVYNVSKKHNIGTLARSAAIFGVKEFCLVGSQKFNTFGSHGSSDYVAFRHFTKLSECCAYLKNEEGCEIIGVEIHDDAQPVHAKPFAGPTAFLLGNEGTGLSEKEMEFCDKFVYISQYGPGSASLNVVVAASIVLHEFAVWAGYRERAREGAKFDVGDRPPRTTRRGVVPLTEEETRLLKEGRRANRGTDVMMGEQGEEGGFFGDIL
ncbi:hypothetical protein BSKO_03656 [Bryopsis sp. KO-2023]|nr:hypothetical protein BSKO_03656 [Bryopsis sp. KO-2023]